jgi:acetyltransferase-like isoleucine patch superfamily enzyme
VGGEVRGNYCTLNPIANGVVGTFSNGNLDWVNTTNTQGCTSTIAIPSTGKWYAECRVNYFTSGYEIYIGVNTATAFMNANGRGGEATAWQYSGTGSKILDTTSSAYGASYTVGDVIGIAVDRDAATLTFYKNGASQGTISSLPLTKELFWLGGGGGPTANTHGGSWNFGQRPFSYTAPTGYKALCSQNLPESTAGKLPGNYFGIATYRGTGAYNVISTAIDATTNGGMVWLQARTSGTHQHDLIDSVRGYTKLLDLPSTGAESTYNANIAATNFGYTISDNSNQLNGSAYTYVGWNWAAGGTAVTNTAGSITSSVSANPQAGFSIVTYTGNNTTGTIGHGLSATPSLIILKRRDSATNWVVYSSAVGATQFLYLNTTAAAAAWAGFWGNTAPTTSVFTVSNDGATNASAGTYVAYCFAEVSGYSKFGSYAGNNIADGTFVYCGFKPRFVMIKNITTASNWVIKDSVRSIYNPNNLNLFANLTNAETTEYPVDFLSNGFKLRDTLTDVNVGSSTYIFAAFAEVPLKYARAR